MCPSGERQSAHSPPDAHFQRHASPNFRQRNRTYRGIGADDEPRSRSKRKTPSPPSVCYSKSRSPGESAHEDIVRGNWNLGTLTTPLPPRIPPADYIQSLHISPKSTHTALFGNTTVGANSLRRSIGWAHGFRKTPFVLRLAKRPSRQNTPTPC